MQSYFLNFVKNGNPNGDNLKIWQPSSKNAKKPIIMNIDVNSYSSKTENDNRYLFLDKYFSNN